LSFAVIDNLRDLYLVELGLDEVETFFFDFFFFFCESPITGFGFASTALTQSIRARALRNKWVREHSKVNKNIHRKQLITAILS